MLTKTMTALLAALLLGASAAQAANNNKSGAAESANLESANTADYVAAPTAKPKTKADKQIISDGKCWINTSNGNYGWTECPKASRLGG